MQESIGVVAIDSVIGMTVNVPVDCCIITMEWSGDAIVVVIRVVIVVYHCDGPVRLG